jgi:hypothetical protein
MSQHGWQPYVYVMAPTRPRGSQPWEYAKGLRIGMLLIIFVELRVVAGRSLMRAFAHMPSLEGRC